jgi:hypothetical protein
LTFSIHFRVPEVERLEVASRRRLPEGRRWSFDMDFCEGRWRRLVVAKQRLLADEEQVTPDARRCVSGGRVCEAVVDRWSIVGKPALEDVPAIRHDA